MLQIRRSGQVYDVVVIGSDTVTVVPGNGVYAVRVHHAGRAWAGSRAHQRTQRTQRIREPGPLPARLRGPAHEGGPATGDPPGWVTHTHTRSEPQTFFTPAR